MNDVQTLTNQFLVAMPGMSGGCFEHTVTYLCEHSDQGALGLVVNQPSAYKLDIMLEQLGLENTERSDATNTAIYWGGPVQPERGFVLHQPAGEWESTLEVGNGLGLTTSRDILAAIAQGIGPDHYQIMLGYAGWAAGQLEAEIRHNSWLNTPAEPEVIFHTSPRDRWAEAARLIGVDINMLSQNAGRA